MNIEKIKAYFNKYFLDVIKNQYNDYKGRANRSQYWYFVLFCVLISIPLAIVDVVIGVRLFSTIFSIAVLCPSVCLGIRRLHDLGMSGWFYLLCLVPVVGPIALLVMFCLKGKNEKNKFGEVSKAA